MNSRARFVLTLTAGALIGAAGFNFIGGNITPARAADDTRQQRMDKDKWTSGDYARDAIDHLKKAEDEMQHVADKDGSKVAKEAAGLCGDARTKCDAFIAELDAKDKKKKG